MGYTLDYVLVNIYSMGNVSAILKRPLSPRPKQRRIENEKGIGNLRGHLPADDRHCRPDILGEGQIILTGTYRREDP